MSTLSPNGFAREQRRANCSTMRSRSLPKATLKPSRQSQLVGESGAFSGIARRLCQGIFQKSPRLIRAAIAVQQLTQIHKRDWLQSAFQNVTVAGFGFRESAAFLLSKANLQKSCAVLGRCPQRGLAECNRFPWPSLHANAARQGDVETRLIGTQSQRPAQRQLGVSPVSALACHHTQKIQRNRMLALVQNLLQDRLAVRQIAARKGFGRGGNFLAKEIWRHGQGSALAPTSYPSNRTARFPDCSTAAASSAPRRDIARSVVRQQRNRHTNDIWESSAG